jgi:hypothetical protein
VPCLFRHATNGVTFVLVVDDFGIRYTNVEGRDHFPATLRLLYKITVDMENPNAQSCTTRGMKQSPAVCQGTSTRCSPALGTGQAHARCNVQAYTTRAPQYGAKVQYAAEDDTEPLSKTDIKTLQEIVGSMLYYARAVDGPHHAHCHIPYCVSASFTHSSSARTGRAPPSIRRSIS